MNFEHDILIPAKAPKVQLQCKALFLETAVVVVALSDLRNAYDGTKLPLVFWGVGFRFLAMQDCMA